MLKKIADGDNHTTPVRLSLSHRCDGMGVVRGRCVWWHQRRARLEPRNETTKWHVSGVRNALACGVCGLRGRSVRGVLGKII